MRNIKLLLIFILIILASPLLSASHYITGYVNNARDGTSANDRTIVLWNPTVGISDNLTDIIGVNGNSGVNNIYFIDCEMLNNSCKIGDILNLKVLDNDDNYLSYIFSVNISGSGYDVSPNITLNSPPNITFLNPVNYANLSINPVLFNCSANDLDGNLANITFYSNFSGQFLENETVSVSGNFSSVLFSKYLSEGRYQWNCLAKDNLSISDFFNQNYSFTLDFTPPNISSIFVNETSVCGGTIVRVNCNVSDFLSGVNKVIVQAVKPSGKQNFSAFFLSGNTYYSDILIDEDGEWYFNCIANDSSGNNANFSSEHLYSNIADIFINYSGIFFSENNPVESQEIIINATVYNSGCGNASNFSIGFFKGDPNLGLQIGNNITVSLNENSNITVNISWSAEIGPNNIFVFADNNNSIIESDENNNLANKSINVGAWQIFFGIIGIDKILSDNNLKNMSTWQNDSYLVGNIFVADKEAIIDWSNLIAISQNKSGDLVSDDFSNIDYLLNMTNFNDSVEKIFSNNGIPKRTDNFFFKQKYIGNVPIINSTNTSDFITGILWDSSDDKGDGEYSINDNEDLVFITKVNQKKQGYYGSYDYEANIPVRLRDCNKLDRSEIYFYYELN